MLTMGRALVVLAMGLSTADECMCWHFQFGATVAVKFLLLYLAYMLLL